MKKLLIFGLLAGFAALGLNSCGGSVVQSDDFIKEAAMGGMSEVELGRLAVQKSQNPEVKAFGQKMVDDHSKANNELKDLAARKKITLPTQLDSTHQSMVNKLNALSGADFDKEYVKMMVDDHQEDVEAFKKQAESGTDTDVKSWAGKTLPVLQSHLTMIKSINERMK